MSGVISLISLVLGAFLGLAISRLLRGSERYLDPQLHPGRWKVEPGDSGGLTSRRIDLPDQKHHTGMCVATRCYIGPNTAHVDICDCGKKRYGVFGAWS